MSPQASKLLRDMQNGTRIFALLTCLTPDSHDAGCTSVRLPSGEIERTTSGEHRSVCLIFRELRRAGCVKSDGDGHWSVSAIGRALVGLWDAKSPHDKRFNRVLLEILRTVGEDHHHDE